MATRTTTPTSSNCKHNARTMEEGDGKTTKKVKPKDERKKQNENPTTTADGDKNSNAHDS